jgi:hypothetical protein
LVGDITCRADASRFIMSIRITGFPTQSKRDLEVAVVSAAYGKREMIENALAKTLNFGEPMGGGGIGGGIFPLSGNQSHICSCQGIISA